MAARSERERIRRTARRVVSALQRGHWSCRGWNKAALAGCGGGNNGPFGQAEVPSRLLQALSADRLGQQGREFPLVVELHGVCTQKNRAPVQTTAVCMKQVVGCMREYLYNRRYACPLFRQEGQRISDRVYNQHKDVERIER